MRREIMSSLIKWKNDIDKKVLIISGAHMVGKTYIVREFAKTYYENYVEINLSNLDARNIFKGNLVLKDLIMQISLLNNSSKITQRKTLIFIDDIQAYPEAITSLKVFGDNSGYDVIACASLLDLNKINSYPVGYVKNMILYPFSFIEFLWANNVEEKVINKIKECYETKSMLPETQHIKLNDYFLKYIVVGGMPSVIEKYINNFDFNEVNKKQLEIMNNYCFNIYNYASKIIRDRVKNCFDSIPNQLAKEHKKYQYKLIKTGGNYQYFYSSISYLCDSKIVSKVSKINEILHPLKAYKDLSAYKLYLNDSGLLLAMYENPVIRQEILNGNLGVFKGGILENAVYNMLRKNFSNLYYYEKKETKIDFLTVIGDNIVPIEVKSTYNTRFLSLASYIKKHNSKRAIKLSLNNVNCNHEIIECYPLYMSEFINEK